MIAPGQEAGREWRAYGRQGGICGDVNKLAFSLDATALFLRSICAPKVTDVWTFDKKEPLTTASIY